MTKRDLTTLEYVVMGMMSLKPQSGYDIVSAFEDGSYSWSASPGSIYPMLKRLENQGMIGGELDMGLETRPRKLYSLTSEGEAALDEWLRETPRMRPFYQEREIALLRFQFIENRLSPPEILRWIDNYLDAVRYATAVSQAYIEPINKAMSEGESAFSLHSQLLMDFYVMEINSLRTWLEMTRARLTRRSP